MKLNIGAGRTHYEGFTNVDIQDWDGNTNIKHDLTTLPYPFEDNSIEEITSSEFLEHISFRKTMDVLLECYRILQPKGTIKFQVPDCGKAMEYFLKGQVCTCVPHKARRPEDFKADPNCWNCHGLAKIHPDRWLFSFTGAQKHPWDIHQNIFTQERMTQHLEEAGFSKIKYEDNIYKLIVTAQKL